MGGGRLLVALVAVTFFAVAVGASKEQKCKTCKELVTGLEKGMEQTTKTSGGHGGGNTDWEERRLKGWARSELRLVEVLESACGAKKASCHGVMEDVEAVVEEWFYNEGRDEIPLHKLICVEHLEVCCPAGVTGDQCQINCPVGVDGAVCSGRGKCRGDGLRKGNGTCACDTTSQGQDCGVCREEFIEKGSTCVACDSSCEGGCTETGPRGCKDCKKGYYKNAATNACDRCNEACDGCILGGSQHCTVCASGFELDEQGVCANVDDCTIDSCHPTEECVDGINKVECVCAAGFVRNEEGAGCLPEQAASPTDDRDEL